MIVSTQSPARLAAGLFLAVAGVFCGPSARADGIGAPKFEAFLPRPTTAEIVESEVGRDYIDGVALGLTAMADPVCRQTKKLTAPVFVAAARKIIVGVADADERANLTGLDAIAADAAYEKEMGPERFRIIAGLQAQREVPAIRDYWDAATARWSDGIFGASIDRIGSALHDGGWATSGKFFSYTFDSPQFRSRNDGRRRQYAAALSALPAEIKAAIGAHPKIADGARLKATDIMKANRLGTKDIEAIIFDDLAQACISRQAR